MENLTLTQPHYQIGWPISDVASFCKMRGESTLIMYCHRRFDYI
jgi:hypothetical protein